MRDRPAADVTLAGIPRRRAFPRTRVLLVHLARLRLSTLLDPLRVTRRPVKAAGWRGRAASRGARSLGLARSRRAPAPPDRPPRLTIPARTLPRLPLEHNREPCHGAPASPAFPASHCYVQTVPSGRRASQNGSRLPAVLRRRVRFWFRRRAEQGKSVAGCRAAVRCGRFHGLITPFPHRGASAARRSCGRSSRALCALVNARGRG
jgi:hypothetical protein